ncbi:MAG: nucleotidyltransferase domain-containing protein [Candidatus Woesearchaeota archaeon]
MITKISEVEFAMLNLFTQGYDKELYLREIEKHVPYSFRTVQVVMNRLEEKRVLKSKTKGKIKLYCIEENSLAKEYFILTEQYKRIQFFEKNPLIREVFDQIQDSISGICILFGSYVKGLEKEESDLDVFVVGSYDEKKVIEIGINYGFSISIKSYPKKIFDMKIHDDILLKEVVKNHIIVAGNEGFMGVVKKWTN